MIKRESVPGFELAEEAKGRFTLKVTPSITHNVRDLAHQVLTLSKGIGVGSGAIVEVSAQEGFTPPDLQLHILGHDGCVQLLRGGESCISLDILEEYLGSCGINRKSLEYEERQG